MQNGRTRLFTAGAVTILVTITLAPFIYSQGQGQGDDRRGRFRPNGLFEEEGPPSDFGDARRGAAVEAPAGFDNLTNGFSPQGPAYGLLTESAIAARADGGPARHGRTHAPRSRRRARRSRSPAGRSAGSTGRASWWRQ